MNIEEEWTTPDGETWMLEDFLIKMDSEGGIGDMLGWGGSDVFPPCIRDTMKVVEEFVRALDEME